MYYWFLAIEIKIRVKNLITFSWPPIQSLVKCKKNLIYKFEVEHLATLPISTNLVANFHKAEKTRYKQAYKPKKYFKMAFFSTFEAMGGGTSWKFAPNLFFII